MDNTTFRGTAFPYFWYPPGIADLILAASWSIHALICHANDCSQASLYSLFKNASSVGDNAAQDLQLEALMQTRRAGQSLFLLSRFLSIARPALVRLQLSQFLSCS